MTLDASLKARFDLFDDDQLVAHRARTDLTPDAYEALDAIIVERKIGPMQIAEIRAQPALAPVAADTLHYAEKCYRHMRVWALIVILWWPAAILLFAAYTYVSAPGVSPAADAPQWVYLLIVSLWMAAIVVYIGCLVLMAQAVGKSAALWVVIAILFSWFGWIMGWLVMANALDRLRARSHGAVPGRTAPS